jgi:hypothetical protein
VTAKEVFVLRKLTVAVEGSAPAAVTLTRLIPIIPADPVAAEPMLRLPLNVFVPLRIMVSLPEAPLPPAVPVASTLMFVPLSGAVMVVEIDVEVFPVMKLLLIFPLLRVSVGVPPMAKPLKLSMSSSCAANFGDACAGADEGGHRRA